MYTLSSNKTETSQQLSVLLNRKVKIKPLFVGYGVYLENIMFGIYVNERFHLKAEGRLAVILEKLGAIIWYYSSRKNMCSQSKYYCLPENLYQNPKLICRLIFASYKQITRAQTVIKSQSKSQIRELPNLTIRHERALSKVNIKNIDEFRNTGAINAFIALKKVGNDVSFSYFLSLVAALKGKLTQVLTLEEREIAFTQLNEQLAKENMRAINPKDLYR